jgi:DeoR/GlpR family transcriptional regulator of sugar metabolism
VYLHILLFYFEKVKFFLRKLSLVRVLYLNRKKTKGFLEMQVMERKSEKRPMTQHRRAQIADLMKQRDSVRVEELAERFGVSHVTIRNDLAKLERDGYLIRDRGGAIPTAAATERMSTISSLLALGARADLNVDEKQRIGIAAAGLVEAGDTIILDAGTTVVEMVRHLANTPTLTVVTNALNVALHVDTTTDADLILLGGTLSRQASSTLGPMAESVLSNLMVGKLFLGTQAWSLEDGLTDTTMEIAQIKRAMIRAAKQVILMVDSSKLGSSGFIKVAPLSDVHIIITDSGLPADARDALERAGIRLILV